MQMMFMAQQLTPPYSASNWSENGFFHIKTNSQSAAAGKVHAQRALI